MTVPARLLAFAAALAVLFGAGFAAGAAVGPERDVDPPATHGDGHATETTDE